MKKISAFILGLAILVSGSTQAVTLEEWLTQKVEEVSSPFKPEWSFYHYTNLPLQQPELADPDSRQRFVENYIQPRMGYAWYVNAVGNNAMAAGPGLYAALDPIVSSGYGNTLFRFSVKSSQARYLKVAFYSLRSNDSTVTGDPALIRWFQSGIGFNLGIYLYPTYSKDPTALAGKALLLQIFRKLNIIALEYPYSSVIGTSFCSNSRQVAMVFFGRPVSESSYQIDPKDFDFQLVRKDLQNLSDSEKKAAQLVQQRVRALRGVLSQLTSEEIQDVKMSTMDCR